MSLQRITCPDVTSGLIHECDPCNRELGRVRGVILFTDDVDVEALRQQIIAATDAEKIAALETAFESLVTTGKAHLISETTGTYDGGSPQEGDGYGDESSRLLGYEHTLTYKDPSYANNADFYEDAEKAHFKVCWRTETLLHFGDKPASIQAIDPVEEDLTSAVVWNVTCKWKSKKKAALAPLDPLHKYFEGCWADQA